MLVKTIRSNIRAIAMFFLGICLGGASFLFLYGNKLERLLLERNAIYYANNQKYREILKLQKELEKLGKEGTYQSQHESKIQKIVVEVITHQHFVGLETIKDYVEKMMEPFIGKSTQLISNNPDIVAAVLEQKQIPLDAEKKVQIGVKYLSFHYSTLKIWVKLDVFDQKQPSIE